MKLAIILFMKMSLFTSASQSVKAVKRGLIEVRSPSLQREGGGFMVRRPLSPG